MPRHGAVERHDMLVLAQSHPWSNIPVGEHLFYFSPMIALVCTMLAVVASPLIFGRWTRTLMAVVSVGVLAAFVLALRVFEALGDGGVSGLSTQPAEGMLIADRLSICFQLVLFVFLAGVMWLWWIGSAESERNVPEFLILLLGSALGMVLMVSTLNLLMIVVAIEAASLPSYAIVGFDKRDAKGAEASLKYMIFGAVCAAIMLYGASLLYGLVGSLSVVDVAHYTVGHLEIGENRILLSAALLCFLAGVAFKISAVPFHFWCPDAFEGAKIEVTTWLSVVSKAAGLVLLTRLVLAFCAAVDVSAEMSLIRPMAWVIGIMAAITCTYANFAAYQQESVKRLLAYSSIAHAGYMMMAAAVFIHPGTAGSYAGLTALLVYIMIYLFMNLGAFGVTALVAWDSGSDRIEAFSGLMRRAPWAAVPMIICLVSLVGIPPLAGFLGKWWVLVALGSMHSYGSQTAWSSFSALGWFLVVVLVLNTLFSLYYYMRVVVQIALRDEGRPRLRAPFGGLALVNVCGIVLLLLFILAQPLKSTAERFALGVYDTATTLPSDESPVASVADDSSGVRAARRPPMP